MNPRHRRLLIPGLLVALIVIVVIASVRRADGVEVERAEPGSPSARTVSVLEDPRLPEISGMVVSREHDDLAYLINDSDQAQAMYAVEISTGRVVGTTRVTGGTWRDTEALTIDSSGTIWVADTGDNQGRRSDAALYRFAEPGPGDHTLDAEVVPVSYTDDRRLNVESILVDPRNQQVYLISKGVLGGQVMRLPTDLTGASVVAEDVAGAPHGPTTDATFSADGEYAYLLKFPGRIDEFRTDDWSRVRSLEIPAMVQPEALALSRGSDSLLVTSEGLPSPLVEVDIPTPESEERGAAESESTEIGPDVPSPTAPTDSSSPMIWAAGGAAVVALAATGFLVWRTAKSRNA